MVTMSKAGMMTAVSRVTWPYFTSIPQSALRDNCTGETRLTPIELPKIEGSTLTWKVPLTAFPKEVPLGTTLTDLLFTVTELQDFGGPQVPDTGQTPYDGVYGLAFGVVDDAKSTNSFKVG